MILSIPHYACPRVMNSLLNPSWTSGTPICQYIFVDYLGSILKCRLLGLIFEESDLEILIWGPMNLSIVKLPYKSNIAIYGSAFKKYWLFLWLLCIIKEYLNHCNSTLSRKRGQQ